MEIFQILKRIAYWLLPQGIYGLLRDWRDRYLPEVKRAEAQKVISENRQFKNLYQGKRCFILACGPSIKGLDLSPLAGEICISVANFFVHPEFKRIQPKFHCIAPLHPPFTDEDGIRWFKDMEKHINETGLLLSFTDRPLITKNNLLRNQKVRYLHFKDRWENPMNQDFNLDDIVPGCQSVSVMALMAALYLGCSEIFLIGIDHTFLDQNSGKYDYKHFYEAGKGINALGEDSEPADLESQFWCNGNLWKQYKILRKLADDKKIKIYNASPGGILDLFPRVKFETLFSKKN
jgi:hypothetical protein